MNRIRIIISNLYRKRLILCIHIPSIMYIPSYKINKNTLKKINKLKISNIKYNLKKYYYILISLMKILIILIIFRLYLFFIYQIN